MKISIFYGKEVESTQGRTGYVLSVLANGGKLECLLCADGEENEFYVDVRNIVKIGEKIIYEDRESAMKEAEPVRLGRAGFDENGRYLGVLEELTLTDNRLRTAKIGKKNYPAEGLTCGDIVIVRRVKRLTADVVKDGKIVFKKGSYMTAEALAAAEKAGAYVQANLKCL